jgi:hypothetical protein
MMGEANEAIEWTKALRGALKIRRWRPTKDKWDTSSKDNIRRTCKDVGSWIQTCRLLDAPDIRPMRRTNEYLNVDKGYALAMDRVLMPKSTPATNIKQVGDKRKNDENEFLGRIARRVGKFWDPQNNGRAKAVHECMIMETDREIEAVHAQNLRHMRDMEAEQTDSPTATQRTRKANLINKVPTERASSIPLAKHGQPIVNNISKTIMKYIQTNYTLNYTAQRPQTGSIMTHSTGAYMINLLISSVISDSK